MGSRNGRLFEERDVLKYFRYQVTWKSKVERHVSHCNTQLLC